MSLASVFFWAALYGAYQLGRFNERRPGESWDACKSAAARLWVWLNPK